MIGGREEVGFLLIFPLVVSKIIDKCPPRLWNVWIKEKPRIARGVALGEDLPLLCSMETRNKPFELLLVC